METLNKAWEGAAQEMYAATQGAGAPGGESQPGPDNADGSASSSEDGDVSDVEFEEVDDKK